MKQSFDAIASNLFRVRQSIAEAARLAGRKQDEVRLIAVSKTHSHEAVAAAIAAGQKDFGESTTQESVPKISHLAKPSITWHFIGHLQTNKAKFIPGNFSWLHSLDSLGLARKISRHAQEQSAAVNILIEVNVTQDTRKHGVVPEVLVDFIEQLIKANLPALSLRGLMTIGPHAAAEQEIRRCFAKLRELRDECRKRFALPDFTELSMGMSGDYEEAIKEGATMVRVGTAIFGERDYSLKRL
jgi:PLP dependent protein